MAVNATNPVTFVPRSTQEVFNEWRQVSQTQQWPDTKGPLTVHVTLRRARRTDPEDPASPLIDMTVDQETQIREAMQAQYEAEFLLPYQQAFAAWQAADLQWRQARAAALEAGEAYTAPRPTQPSQPAPHVPFSRDVRFTVADFFALLDPSHPESSPAIAQAVGTVFTQTLAAIDLIGKKKGVI